MYYRPVARGFVLGALLALSGAAQGQGLFGGLIEKAKREAEARARDAVDRATRKRQRTPIPAPSGARDGAPPSAAAAASSSIPGDALTRDTPFSASEIGRQPRTIPAQYASLPTRRSFWPAPEAYVPPAQRAQVPTRVPPGTPDSSTNGNNAPPTQEGGFAWVVSSYELKTLSWGDALSPHGSAGLPLYAARNINNTPARQKWISTFDGWIRATYQPMGLLPVPFRNIFPEKAKADHIPVQYGVTYNLYWPWIRKGKLDRPPMPPASWIGVTANALPSADPAAMINIPDRSFAFTMSYDGDARITVPQEAAGLETEAEWVRRRIGIDAPVLLTTENVVVLLTRDGKLPVRQLTIGETLDRAEAGLRVTEAFSDGSRQAQIAGIAAMRARHAHELNAPAWVRNARFSLQDFYNDDEVYGRGDKDASYPVYAFDEATYAAARTDGPQWLAVVFPRYLPSDSWAEVQVFDQMVHHFNFAYARDAIFHPERVAGKPYTPR